VGANVEKKVHTEKTSIAFATQKHELHRKKQEKTRSAVEN
jgi:hypothetical protein